MFVTYTELGEFHSAGPGTDVTIECWQCGKRKTYRAGADVRALLVDHVRREHPEVEVPDVLSIEEG